MYIYCDESGIFANPQERENTVSCFASIAIPESVRPGLLEEFELILAEWGLEEDEVKGKDLDEEMMDEVLDLMVQADLVAEIVAVDLGLHSPEDIEEHKRRQGQGLVRNLDDRHPEEVVERVYRLKEELEELSNPLYIQSVLMTYAVRSILQITTLYYGQRLPEELGRFVWVFDAKDTNPTPFEMLWRTIVTPILEATSLSEPLAIAEDEVDYSAFSRFMHESDELPEHLRGRVLLGQDSYEFVDVNLILNEYNDFIDSREDRALQLADIVATCFRRAVSNTLGIEGGESLPDC